MEKTNKDSFSSSLIQYREILKKENKKPSILLHVCCGACSCYPLLFLIDLFDISVFFSNSNIYPLEEYNKRKEATIKYISYLNDKFSADIKFIEDKYNYEEFSKDLEHFKDEKEGGRRCYLCIEKRLRNLFEYANNNHFKYVSTIMSISRNKNINAINNIGKTLENEYNNITFLTFDFKKNNGQDIGVAISKKLDIYRQNYCGCEFSRNK